MGTAVATTGARTTRALAVLVAGVLAVGALLVGGHEADAKTAKVTAAKAADGTLSWSVSPYVMGANPAAPSLAEVRAAEPPATYAAGDGLGVHRRHRDLRAEDGCDDHLVPRCAGVREHELRQLRVQVRQPDPDAGRRRHRHAGGRRVGAGARWCALRGRDEDRAPRRHRGDADRDQEEGRAGGDAHRVRRSAAHRRRRPVAVLQADGQHERQLQDPGVRSRWRSTSSPRRHRRTDAARSGRVGRADPHRPEHEADGGLDRGLEVTVCFARHPPCAHTRHDEGHGLGVVDDLRCERAVVGAVAEDAAQDLVERAGVLEDAPERILGEDVASAPPGGRWWVAKYRSWRSTNTRSRSTGLATRCSSTRSPSTKCAISSSVYATSNASFDG